MPDARKLFEALVREHAEMLIVYLNAALGKSADVDDLFQETMVVAWRRLDEFDQTRAFGPWLRGIARKLVIAHNRKRIRRVCDPAVLDQIDARLDQVCSRSGDTWEEKIAVLRQCVESLPEHYRQAVGLRYFRQQAIRQLSDTLDLSHSAVKKRLQRARSLILDCIDQKLPPAECTP